MGARPVEELLRDECRDSSVLMTSSSAPFCSSLPHSLSLPLPTVQHEPPYVDLFCLSLILPKHALLVLLPPHLTAVISRGLQSKPRGGRSKTLFAFKGHQDQRVDTSAVSLTHVCRMHKDFKKYILSDVCVQVLCYMGGI